MIYIIVQLSQCKRTNAQYVELGGGGGITF